MKNQKRLIWKSEGPGCMENSLAGLDGVLIERTKLREEKYIEV